MQLPCESLRFSSIRADRANSTANISFPQAMAVLNCKTPIVCRRPSCCFCALRKSIETWECHGKLAFLNPSCHTMCDIFAFLWQYRWPKFGNIWVIWAVAAGKQTQGINLVPAEAYPSASQSATAELTLTCENPRKWMNVMPSCKHGTRIEPKS